jgi:hypothetical protein
MNRREAVRILAMRDVAILTPNERRDLVMDWWTIDAEEPCYVEFPNRLKHLLETTDPPEDATDPIFDPLLQVALRASYIGVTNSYLEDQLRTFGKPDVVVLGTVEKLETCPCCRYRTLPKRGAYNICKVCFWEDNGSGDFAVVNGPNHMTLENARANFELFGASSQAAVPLVLKDGCKRYERMV